jgi:peptidoglycan hydrolase-like protein with peptidoglycan-binding domain
MMIAVRNEVKAATRGKQVPREDSSLSNPFYFRPAIAAADATPESASTAVAEPTGNAPVVDREVVFWQSIQNSNSLLQYQAYLDQYPDGTFARLARARIEEMKIEPSDTSRSGEQMTSRTAPDTTVPTPEEIERSLGLNRAGRSRVQLALTLLGYKTGGTDGSLGPKSRAAIRAWQTDLGDVASGYLTPQQHAKLLDMAKPKLAVWDEAQKAKAAAAQPAAEAAKSEQQPADSGGAVPAAEQEPQEIVSQEPVPVPIITAPPEETAPKTTIQPVLRKGSNGGGGTGSGGSGGNGGGGGWN